MNIIKNHKKETYRGVSVIDYIKSDIGEDFAKETISNFLRKKNV